MVNKIDWLSNCIRKLLQQINYESFRASFGNNRKLPNEFSTNIANVLRNAKIWLLSGFPFFTNT